MPTTIGMTPYRLKARKARTDMRDGAFFTVADRLRGGERANALALWKRKGKHAFEAELGGG